MQIVELFLGMVVLTWVVMLLLAITLWILPLLIPAALLTLTWLGIKWLTK